jgi:hypothetical protein
LAFDRVSDLLSIKGEIKKNTPPRAIFFFLRSPVKSWLLVEKTKEEEAIHTQPMVRVSETEGTMCAAASY